MNLIGITEYFILLQNILKFSQNIHQNRWMGLKTNLKEQVIWTILSDHNRIKLETDNIVAGNKLGLENPK